MKVSIIGTHFSENARRSLMMMYSYQTLFETAPNAEIIIVDNGGNERDSEWLLSQTEAGNIACYVRNRHNMHLGYARNQALKLTTGDYIVVTDNDIEFKQKWLEVCVTWLEKNPGKYLATPLMADPMNHIRDDRWVGEQGGWRLNTRAGSNCFVMRRSDFEALGDFPIHEKTGCKWVDNYVRQGYAMAVCPKPYAVDMGFRQGANWSHAIEHHEL